MRTGQTDLTRGALSPWESLGRPVRPLLKPEQLLGLAGAKPAFTRSGHSGMVTQGGSHEQVLRGS